MAIAALAMAGGLDTSGDFSNADYLSAAEKAFAFFRSAQYRNDQTMVKENMLDDYCALSAATELYKATKKDIYKQAAEEKGAAIISQD